MTSIIKTTAAALIVALVGNVQAASVTSKSTERTDTRSAITTISVKEAIKLRQAPVEVIFVMPGAISGIPVRLTAVRATYASGSVVNIGREQIKSKTSAFVKRMDDARKQAMFIAQSALTPLSGRYRISSKTGTYYVVFVRQKQNVSDDPLYSDTNSYGPSYEILVPGSNIKPPNTKPPTDSLDNLSPHPPPVVDPYNDVPNVWYDYGPGISDPHDKLPDSVSDPVSAAPEPLTLAGILAGCVSLGGYIRCRMVRGK